MITGELSVLSAMITPAVLILATGSLLLTTSQRLSRSTERARKLAATIEPLAKDPAMADRRAFHLRQLMFTARRVRLLQKSMVTLYLAIAFFVATSGTIGLIEWTNSDVGWIPVGCGIAGAMLLLLASTLLIVESRVLLAAVNEEMSDLTRICGEKEVQEAKRAM